MIVIVDYEVGNVGSIVNMLKRVGAKSTLTSDTSVIASAKKLIVPGVGHFDHGMKNLKRLGLIDVLNEKVLNEKIPTLGICLGMHLFTKHSEEGNSEGLGWVRSVTRKFQFAEPDRHLKIPHMGWNRIHPTRTHGLFSELPVDPRFYFVHSYYVEPQVDEVTLSRTNYGFPFASAICEANVVGVQFHPEKSHRFGMQLLKNFAENM